MLEEFCFVYLFLKMCILKQAGGLEVHQLEVPFFHYFRQVVAASLTVCVAEMAGVEVGWRVAYQHT